MIASEVYHSRWSDDETLRLFEMVANGKTRDEIAAALGRTRNAVVFKLARIKQDPELMKLYAERRGFVEKRTRLEEQRRRLDCMPNPFRFVRPEW